MGVQDEQVVAEASPEEAPERARRGPSKAARRFQPNPRMSYLAHHSASSCWARSFSVESRCAFSVDWRRSPCASLKWNRVPNGTRLQRERRSRAKRPDAQPLRPPRARPRGAVHATTHPCCFHDRLTPKGRLLRGSDEAGCRTRADLRGTTSRRRACVGRCAFVAVLVEDPAAARTAQSSTGRSYIRAAPFPKVRVVRFTTRSDIPMATASAAASAARRR